MTSEATRAAFVFICAFILTLNFQGQDVSASPTTDSWGQWSDWTTCSTECGPGLQSRTRACRNGACQAKSDVQGRSCEVKVCPASQPSYRQAMCTKYDIQVLSGARYEWQPYVHPTDGCKLACRAKEVSFYSNLPERARDGELCHKAGQPKAVCFKGVCKPVGCDNIVMSSARQDNCGVCGGDGSDCKAVSGVFTNSQLPRGINHVISIPAGSTSINITELSPSRNHLILQGLSGKVYLDAGHGRRASVTVQAAGTTVQYVGKTSVNPRESILSKGPTNSTIYVKILSRGSIPNIAYTFSVPIEYDTQALMSGIIQRPAIETAPLHLKEDDVAYSAVHGGHRSVQRTDDAVRDEMTTGPMPDSKDIKQKETFELTESEDDLLEASGEVGVEIIDSGPGGSSIVSSYDVSIGKGGVEVLQKGDGDEDSQEGSDDDEEDDDNFESSDNDDDDDDDDDEDETGDGINSSARKPVSIGNNKHGVISRTKRPPFYRQSMEYEGTHEIDVTYFNNDYSYGSNYIPGDSNESNRDGGEETIYEATRVRSDQPIPNNNERKFKMPKFSNSFTFANKFKNPVFTNNKDKNNNDDNNNGNGNNNNNNNYNNNNDNTYNIKVKPGPRGYAGGYGTSALEAAPKTVRKTSHYESERDRMVRERQKLLDERNERVRKRMEDYNRRLREYQERMRQRRREALQRSYRLNNDRNRGRPGAREADRYDLNGNDRNRIPSTPSSAFVQPARNANPNPTIIKRVSLTLEPGDETRRRIPSVIPRTRESTSTSTSTNTRSSSSSRVNIIPVIHSEDVLSQQQNVRKIIPRIPEQDNVGGDVSSQTPDEIISRTSDNDPTTNSQDPRKIISRVTENQPTSNPGPAPGDIIPRVSVPNVQTGPDFIPPGDIFEQVIDGPSRTVIDSSRIIRTNGQPPRYIPNERGTYTSALSGGDPNVLSSRTNGIIPNRVEASGMPESRTLATADERQPFPNNEWRISGLTECTHPCGGGVQQTVVVCVDTGTQAVVTDENCRLVRRPAVKAVPCNKRPCPARWVPSYWSSCSVTCGDGEQTRTVNCQARVSPTLNLTMPEGSCQNSETPVQTRSCNPQPCSSWSVGNWSQCSSDCGDGVRSRDVTCVGLDQEELDDTDCDSLKQDTQEPCNLGQCGKGWFFTAWPEQCPVACGKGVLTRKVFCASEDGEALPESRCDTNNRPQTTRPCRSDTPCGGSWYTSPWSVCNVTCGSGSRSRDVLCIKMMPGDVYAVVSEENCAGSPKPDEEVACEEEPCTPEWYTTSWGQCSASCGNGYKTREIKCLSPLQRNDDQCPIGDKPKTRESCNAQSCRVVKPAGIKPTSEDESCKDKFSQCRIVKRARLCKYSYYKKMCCSSCS